MLHLSVLVCCLLAALVVKGDIRDTWLWAALTLTFTLWFLNTTYDWGTAPPPQKEPNPMTITEAIFLAALTGAATRLSPEEAVEYARTCVQEAYDHKPIYNTPNLAFPKEPTECPAPTPSSSPSSSSLLPPLPSSLAAS